MSFELNKLSAGVPVSEIPIGGSFEHEGEVYLKIKTITAIGNAPAKINKDDVMCLSLETFQINILTGNTEVLKNKIVAKSTLNYDV